MKMRDSISLYLGKVIKEDTQSVSLPSNKKFCIKLDGSFVVSGSRGYGKTVTSKVIAEESLLKGVPTILFDPKGDLSQLSQPFEAHCLFGLSKEEVENYERQLELFNIKDLTSKYVESISPQLFDHNYLPGDSDVRNAFHKTDDGKTPLTIVRLLSKEEEINKKVFKNWLSAIKISLSEMSRTNIDRLIVIDEVHRYLSDKTLYGLLDIILREGRNAGLKFVFATQKMRDLRGLLDFMKYRIDMVGERRCIPSFRPTPGHDFVIMVNYGENVLIRWLLTLHRKESMTSEDYFLTKDFWDTHIHPMTDLLIANTTLRSLNLEEVEKRLLNFLNSKPICMDFDSAEDTLKKLGVKLNVVKNLLSNKVFRNLGHYHAWLDYEKLGFSILAFFICKSEEPHSDNYTQGIGEILKSYNTIEMFEIESPDYVNVDLLAKLRFRNMTEYYDIIANKVLRISKRGKSEEERFKQFLEHFVSKLKEKGIFDIRQITIPLAEEFIPDIPPEQLVSGCIYTKTFSEKPTCYIDEKLDVFRTLKNEEIEALKILAEIDYSEGKRIPFNIDSIYSGMKQHGLIGENLAKVDLESCMERMVNLGIIKGAYVELPWRKLGYQTTFIIGQLNLRNIETQATRIAQIPYVQEAHTIVGTYDIIIKVRYTNADQLINEISNNIRRFVENSLHLTVKRDLKKGYSLRSV
jgi:DNA-binding Lrp family transcriptional regulator